MFVCMGAGVYYNYRRNFMYVIFPVFINFCLLEFININWKYKEIIALRY